MRIAAITLCRDRLKYTQHCFGKLWELAGYPFDHFVFDNGSGDGTPTWLLANSERFKRVLFWPENLGLSRSANLLLREILAASIAYDALLSFDNDCEPVTPNFLARMAAVAETDPKLIVSAWVEGTTNRPSINTQGTVRLPNGREERIYFAGHCGGLCRLAPLEVHRRLPYPMTLPLAAGHDSWFSPQARSLGFKFGFLRDVIVNHYLTTKGQEADPDMAGYFARKYREERTILPPATER